MKIPFSVTEFYEELKYSLPESNMEVRKVWVRTILEQDVDLKEFSGLLLCDRKVATRFLWFLTEVGMADPKRLFSELPFLWEFSDQLNPAYKQSFVSFWRIAGIPPENEGEAIEYSFQWLLSADTNVTIKSRAALLLLKLTKKYPELKNELKLCLKDQVKRYSRDFEKRVVKILKELEQ